MLPAIYFNDNSELMSCKIGEVWTDRRLTSKVVLLERRLPQMLPELLFGFSRVTPQDTRARHAPVDRTLRSLWHLAPPTPDPSPPRAARAGGGEKVRAR